MAAVLVITMQQPMGGAVRHVSHNCLLVGFGKPERVGRVRVITLVTYKEFFATY